MDDLEQKALMYVLAKKIKEFHRQKNVYLGVLQVVKNSGLFPGDSDFPSVDELVKDALQSSDVQAMTDDAFAFLDEWLPPIPEVDLEKVQRLWLERWKPDGRDPS